MIKKPFYLEKNQDKVKAYHIYTRTGDRNTPINKNASLGDIEYMWKERFGLHLDVYEKFKFYLKDIEEWNIRFETNESAFYKPDPDFSIELSEFYTTDYVEPFNTFCLDNSLLYGEILFKCGSNVVLECDCAYCDGGRFLIPLPKLYSYQDTDDELVYFYYYNLDEFEGLFVKLITKNTFIFNCRIPNFPFITVTNTKMLNKFIEYLKDNIKASDINCDTFFNINNPNEYTSSVNLESLVYIKSVFEEWKRDYTKFSFNI